MNKFRLLIIENVSFSNYRGGALGEPNNKYWRYLFFIKLTGY